MDKPSEEMIESARAILKKAGFFTDNLWHIEDVKIKTPEKISDEDAMAILERVLSTEVVANEIYECIEYALEAEGFQTQ